MNGVIRFSKRWSGAVWIAGLSLCVAIGLAAGVFIFAQGLWATNLSDLVPWGLWITIDLSSIALSAGAFLLSATVYLLRVKRLMPVAKTAVFIGLIGYSMAVMTLLLDIGRPDRFWHAMVFWNVHSPLWEVTMCVALYFTVLILEVLPIFGQATWFKRRWPRIAGWLHHIHKLAPFLAVAGLALSLLHQSSLGATYGVLKARPVLYRPSMAMMFLLSAMAAGPAFTVLVSKIAGRLSSAAVVDRDLLDQVSYAIGWVLVAYLYVRAWDTLAQLYTYEPGRSEGLSLLLTGPLSFNFWVGEIGLGIIVPMIILLSTRLRQYERAHLLALLLVVAGLIAHRWDTNIVGQMLVMQANPFADAPVYTHYVPSLIEILAGVGVIAYGVLA
ncbi:MAG: polysulfide reductase NrfD, partial [Anaerolineales bacterium]|nr:polysulfide reductase NrfD [Anaerolineales bacterium]